MMILTTIPQAEGRGGRSPSPKVLLKIYFNDDFNNNSAGRRPRRAKPVPKSIVKNIF